MVQEIKLTKLNLVRYHLKLLNELMKKLASISTNLVPTYGRSVFEFSNLELSYIKRNGKTTIKYNLVLLISMSFKLI